MKMLWETIKTGLLITLGFCLGYLSYREILRLFP